MATDFLQVDRPTVTRLRQATALLVGDRRRLEDRGDALRRLLAGLDPWLICDYWNEERVVPLAAERAEAAGLTDPAWTEFAAFARQAAGSAGALHGLIARQLTAAGAQQGIQVVVLKGGPMAEQLYGDPSRRQQSGDVDVIVPRHQLWATSALLQRLGWLAPQDALPDGEFPWHHLTHAAPGAAPEIELHWRTHWYDTGDHAAGLIERSVEAGDLRIPAPVDVLIVLLLGLLRDGLHRLRLAADIATWWDRFGDEHGEEAQATLVSGRLARPLTLSALAAASVVGTPLPESGGGNRRARLLSRVATADRPLSERGVMSQATLVDLLAAPADLRRERWSHGWFRDEAELRSRYPLVPPAAVVPVRAARALRAGASALLTRR